MKKLAFKNPKGGTIYLAKVGFDWGGFWGMFALGGLPFFLRKMNALGAFCLVFFLISTVAIGFEVIANTLSPEEGSQWLKNTGIISNSLLALGVSLYFGFKGGKLTARHYVEKGYECQTQDKDLLERARAKWDMEIK